MSSLHCWAFAWLNDRVNGDEADFTYVQTQKTQSHYYTIIFSNRKLYVYLHFVQIQLEKESVPCSVQLLFLSWVNCFPSPEIFTHVKRFVLRTEDFISYWYPAAVTPSGGVSQFQRAMFFEVAGHIRDLENKFLHRGWWLAPPSFWSKWLHESSGHQ